MGFLTDTDVRVVGAPRVDSGVAFIRIADGPEVRVRWRRVGPAIRWKCDEHRGDNDCSHAHTLAQHLPDADTTHEETPDHD